MCVLDCVMKMINVNGRDSDCGWNENDSIGQVTLGGKGHTANACLNTCLLSTDCNFATMTKQGICHLYTTCTQELSSGYTVNEKICQCKNIFSRVPWLF